ncbi:MAG TPA: metalloregulator ArsR/SmtB family transcription factor [Candidatus Deferrimicrobium sp.]|nr:metalloregulator ArsR/SmtB family transcription factor [Candidatus Deferrimicrobium sp.]
MNEKTFSKFFKAFGDMSRLRILMVLSGGEMTVTGITKAVGLSQPTVSRHLSVLREADIVSDRRQGQQVFYRLNKDVVASCCDGLCGCLAIKIRPGKAGIKSRRSTKERPSQKVRL